MFCINYQRLYKNRLDEDDFHVLVKIVQQESDLLSEDMFPKLETLGLIRYNKSPKDKTKSVRLTKSGKELLQELTLGNSDSQIDLCNDLCDMFESYGMETGNKRRVLVNLDWFMSKADFTEEQIKETMEEWLARGYRMWLENVFWDKSKANVFTTVQSRTLGQSPFYEFMRRKYNMKW